MVVTESYGGVSTTQMDCTYNQLLHVHDDRHAVWPSLRAACQPLPSFVLASAAWHRHSCIAESMQTNEQRTPDDMQHGSMLLAGMPTDY